MTITVRIDDVEAVVDMALWDGVNSRPVHEMNAEDFVNAHVVPVAHIAFNKVVEKRNDARA